jgi:hypothetical protein
MLAGQVVDGEGRRVANATIQVLEMRVENRVPGCL